MRHVRLMAEYGAPPLWTEQGPVTPEELGLSREPSTRIRSWAHEWEFGGGRDSTDEDFAERGRLLAEAIGLELGPRTSVAYEP